MPDGAPPTNDLLRRLPRVDALLAAPEVSALLDEHGRRLVTDAVRAELADVRARLAAGEPLDPAAALAPPACARRVAARLAEQAEGGYPRAINATGVVLHTGLGRAPLPPAAREALLEAARSYAVLEVERASGKRGQRDGAVARTLAEVSGAEAATIVNNNAGATLIALSALAAGRPVIVSRGQLVEIGGSYRIPDVMEQSGCRLVEVGTTNRTHLRDYERALDAHPDAALLLRVHASNYRVMGFTKEVPLADLVALGRARGVPVMDDLGSGCFVDLAPYGLPEEPAVQTSVREGAAVITFSGDKLLGGPQAGLVVGSREHVDRVRRHPLYRALRPGKLTLAALDATLGLYRDPERALQRIPALAAITTPLERVEARAEALAAQLGALDGVEVRVEAAGSKVGGGSYAVEAIPTRIVSLAAAGRKAEDLAVALRTGSPPVFARIHEARLCLDPRTLLPGEDEEVVAAFSAALGD